MIRIIQRSWRNWETIDVTCPFETFNLERQTYIYIHIICIYFSHIDILYIYRYVYPFIDEYPHTHVHIEMLIRLVSRTQRIGNLLIFKYRLGLTLGLPIHSQLVVEVSNGGMTMKTLSTGAGSTWGALVKLSKTMFTYIFLYFANIEFDNNLFISYFCVYIYICISIHTSRYFLLYISQRICVYPSMKLCVYIYIHIYIFIGTQI